MNVQPFKKCKTGGANMGPKRLPRRGGQMLGAMWWPDAARMWWPDAARKWCPDVARVRWPYAARLWWPDTARMW